MSILSFNSYNQLHPVKQFIPNNPGSYNDFVINNNLNHSQDHLRIYTCALAEYKLGYLALQKDINSDTIFL